MSVPDHQESSLARARAGVTWTLERAVRFSARHERALWALVLVVLAGDIALTMRGLHLGHAEGNPVVAWAIGAGGIGGFVFAKVIALSVGITVRLWLPRHASLVPVGLAVPWVFAVVVNAVVIA